MATSAFGKAFRAARAAGETEFEFGGKKYNTKLKDDSPSKTDALAAKGQAGNEAMKKEVEADENYGNEGKRTKSAPPSSDRGIGPYKVFAGPSDTEKQATYDKYAENRKKMGDSGDDSGSKPISESDWAKSVRSTQGSDSGFLGKKMREAMGSSYKKGGSVSSRADGIAQRGKTRGKMC